MSTTERADLYSTTRRQSVQRVVRGIYTDDEDGVRYGRCKLDHTTIHLVDWRSDGTWVPNNF